MYDMFQKKGLKATPAQLAETRTIIGHAPRKLRGLREGVRRGVGVGRGRLFWIIWGFDAVIAAVFLFFFFWGLADGTVSSFNIVLWLGPLAGLAGILGGSLKLRGVAGGADRPDRARGSHRASHGDLSVSFAGKTVYFRTARCCDIRSIVYDAEGSVICEPDGGIDSGGDGRCADFLTTRRARTRS